MILRKADHLPLVKDYLIAVQKANLAAVNDAVNELLIEEEDFKVCCLFTPHAQRAAWKQSYARLAACTVLSLQVRLCWRSHLCIVQSLLAFVHPFVKSKELANALLVLES